jgi:hypothetical protein
MPIGGFNCGPSSTNTPEEMFEAVFAQPIQDNLTDLQGVGDTDQGYSIFLRFQTGVAAAPYLKEDYQEVDCESVRQHLELPAGYDRFSPAWSPETVDLAVCYQSVSLFSNSWTQNGQHYSLVDARSLVAYFHGTGD